MQGEVTDRSSRAIRVAHGSPAMEIVVLSRPILLLDAPVSTMPASAPPSTSSTQTATGSPDASNTITPTAGSSPASTTTSLVHSRPDNAYK
jgi:hypothetical protein